MQGTGGPAGLEVGTGCLLPAARMATEPAQSVSPC